MVHVLPRVTSAQRKTGCANRNVGVQRPSPVSEFMAGITWVQGFPHVATKIKVDAEHPTGMSEPLGLLL